MRRASPCESCCFSQSEENCTAIRLPRIWYEMRFIPVARFLSLSLPLFLSRSLWVVVKPRPHLYLPTYDAVSRALFVPPVILSHFGGSAERVVHSRHSRCIRNVEFPKEKAHTYTYQPIPMKRMCMVALCGYVCVSVSHCRPMLNANLSWSQVRPIAA